MEAGRLDVIVIITDDADLANTARSQKWRHFSWTRYVFLLEGRYAESSRSTYGTQYEGAYKRDEDLKRESGGQGTRSEGPRHEYDAHSERHQEASWGEGDGGVRSSGARNYSDRDESTSEPKGSLGAEDENAWAAILIMQNAAHLIGPPESQFFRLASELSIGRHAVRAWHAGTFDALDGVRRLWSLDVPVGAGSAGYAGSNLYPTLWASSDLFLESRRVRDVKRDCAESVQSQWRGDGLDHEQAKRQGLQTDAGQNVRGDWQEEIDDGQHGRDQTLLHDRRDRYFAHSNMVWDDASSGFFQCDMQLQGCFVAPEKDLEYLPSWDVLGVIAQMENLEDWATRDLRKRLSVLQV